MALGYADTLRQSDEVRNFFGWYEPPEKFERAA
jgi:hypothetical protein